MKKNLEILVCPASGRPLEYIEKNGQQYYATQDQSNKYPIIDGIADFVISTSEEPNQGIEEAYEKALSIYDDYMADNKPHLRLLKRILLGIQEEVEECSRLAKKVFGLSKTGYVLEVPIGTGIFTLKHYLEHPEITFLAVDYSRPMLHQAKKRIQELGVKNVILIRADVAKLPFKNNVFNGVLTLNGIHSFPEKEKAISELTRVLNNNMPFFGSLVLKGERWITDLMIELFYAPGKWFIKPALTKQDFLEILNNNQQVVQSHKQIQPLMIFESIKKGETV